MYIAFAFKSHKWNKWRHGKENMLTFNEPPSMYDLLKAQVECFMADLWDTFTGFNAKTH